jgi:hypothetical protein
VQKPDERALIGFEGFTNIEPREVIGAADKPVAAAGLGRLPGSRSAAVVQI